MPKSDVLLPKYDVIHTSNAALSEVLQKSGGTKKERLLTTGKILTELGNYPAVGKLPVLQGSLDPCTRWIRMES